MEDETKVPGSDEIKVTPGEVLQLQGEFMDSLYRNNKQIRKDRADSIGEDGAIAYKREVEDTLAEIRKLRRDQDGMMDLSPETSHSLKLASDFNGKEWAAKDIEIDLKIRNLEIKYERASARLWKLFKIKV